MAEMTAGFADEESGRKPGAFSRRSVLIGAGTVAAAATAAGARPGTPTEERSAQPANGPVYRETDHIRAFYALSRF